LEALRAHADPNASDQGDAPPSLRDYLSNLWQQMRGIKPTSSVKATALGLAVLHDNAVITEALLDRNAKSAGDEVLEIEGTSVITSNSGPPVSHTFGWIERPAFVLHIAAIHGNVAIVQALIKHGWDVNGRNKNQMTALFVASDMSMIKTLVACGADVNALNRTGGTPLFLAVLRQDPSAVKLLIDHNAKVDAMDTNGETALRLAQGNAEIIQMLKRAGAKE
jgi:ankyrin repeat protein